MKDDVFNQYNNNYEIIINNNNNVYLNNDKVNMIYGYLKAINEFEEYFQKMDNEYVIKFSLCYLIKLVDYNNFKEKINYESLVKYISSENYCKNEINEYINSYKIDFDNITRIKVIDKNNFDSNEQYQLIPFKSKLVDVILENIYENYEFTYSYDFPKLILYLDSDKSKYLEFLFNDFIIDKRLSFSKENSQIFCISKAIIEYDKLNKNFKPKENDKKKWFLIEKEKTKEIFEFLDNSGINFDSENILYDIIDFIGNKTETKHIKKLLKLDALNFKNKSDFKTYNKTNDIVIISPTVYYLLKMNSPNKDLSYYCFSSNGIITIKFINDEESKYIMNDNIISYNHKIKGKSFFERWFPYINFGSMFKYILHKLGISKKKDKKEKILNDDNNIDNNFEVRDVDDFTVYYRSKSIDNINYFSNEPEKKKKNKIKLVFQNCPGIGLQNIGATCYMNATLQCFAHIEKFINFFKYNSQVNNIIDDSNNKKLTPSFKTLIEQLWPDNYLNLKQKYYAPYDFKKKISDMNPLFEGIAANDSKDLVNFIIMTLHEELNKVKVDNNIIINENEVPIDQTNKELVFQFFMKDFTSKNQSIISDLFYAMNCSITECTNCPAKLYNYQIYFFIIFPLEEVRKFKLSNQLNFNNNNMFFNNNNNNVMINNFVFDNNMLINNNMNFLMNNKTVSIYDCFDYDKKINLMSGSNAMYCNNCKQTANCTMQTYLVAGPEILILLLNRGKGKEFDVKIDFFEEINLYNYIEYRDTGFNYTLIGVISHIGESGMSGHFIAYCKDPITNKWNKYNDAIVTEVEDFQNEVINFAMPYLLFYQKVT